MIWRNGDDRQQVYCDIGPYAGMYRMTGYVYGTADEIAALVSSRSNELIVVDTRDEPDNSDERVPDWWPYAAQFPDWHVWRGVAGLLYARRPKSSPPKVVHGKTVEDLRDQIEITISLGD